MSKVTDIKKWGAQEKRKKEMLEMFYDPEKLEMFYDPETEHTVIAPDRKYRGFLELRDALDEQGYDYKVISYLPEDTKIDNVTDEDFE